jgi:hypothetical protein
MGNSIGGAKAKHKSTQTSEWDLFFSQFSGGKRIIRRRRGMLSFVLYEPPDVDSREGMKHAETQTGSFLLFFKK